MATARGASSGFRPGDLTVTATSPVRWEIARSGSMRVPGVVFASPALLPEAADDGALPQVANVATLPGIVRASFAMPDVHWGYGFPIGGVAATDAEAGGVVSPGGVGFDISCGIRTLVTPFSLEEVRPRLPQLLDRLDKDVKRGAGPGGAWKLRGRDELRRVLREGSVAAVAAGFGVEDDLARTEDHGRLAGADVAAVSELALERGLAQIGSLGSGNHFLELQAVDRVVDADIARAFGVAAGQVVVTMHCGSRGLGHQVCTDHVRSMQKAMVRLGIDVPDRQLACAPVDSVEGERYLAGMSAAANYGRANRQVLAESVRDAFAEALGTRDLPLLYDVSHNMAKLERHDVDGRERLLCVHRKGATRALPPGHPELPDDLRAVGQPVIIPGSMGTASWLLAGAGGSEAFASTCHGAGRALSRSAAKKLASGAQVRDELAARGITVRAKALNDLAEEAPAAYKDVDEVVRVCEVAGLSVRVARLVPLGVVKG